MTVACLVRSWADRFIQSWCQRQPFEITEHSIAIDQLPKAFQGFRIVQVSDLHIDRWNAPIVEAAIDTVNALKPDLIVSTGDVIADGGDYLKDVSHLLRQLRATHGKLACLGNHDYSDGNGSDGVRAAMAKAGFDVLVNDSTELTVQNRKIQLAGADDLILGRQCLKATSRRLQGELPRILLSHNPENFEAMAAFQPDLVLSGHTHGGQIRFPRKFQQRFIGSPYIAGLYRFKSSHLYVNRGLGSAVFVKHWEENRIAIPTPRLAVAPEISVFNLFNPRLGPQVYWDRAIAEAIAS